MEKRVVVSGRLELRILQTGRDVIRRLPGARASRHPALPLLGSKEANFLAEIGRRDFRCAGMRRLRSRWRFRWLERRRCGRRGVLAGARRLRKGGEGRFMIPIRQEELRLPVGGSACRPAKLFAIG